MSQVQRKFYGKYYYQHLTVMQLLIMMIHTDYSHNQQGENTSNQQWKSPENVIVFPLSSTYYNFEGCKF